MIKPTLATCDGVLVAPVFYGPRFVSVGGDVLDFAQRGARPTLADAQAAFRDLQARIAAETNLRVQRLLARDALALAEAITETCAHRRAAGWSNPNDADRARGRA